SVTDLALPVTLPIYNWVLVDSMGNTITTDNENPAYVKYQFEQGRYYYKRGLVVFAPGFYKLSINSFIASRGSGAAPITDCPNQKVKPSFPINNGAVNYHLLQYSNDPNVRSWSEENVKLGGLYAFVV